MSVSMNQCKSKVITMFDQQIRPFFKRFEPQVDRLKLKANEVVTKGNVLSQNCLVKARVLQVQAVDSFKNSSLLNKEAMLQLAKEKSSTITDLAVKKSSAALYKSEECKFASMKCLKY